MKHVDSPPLHLDDLAGFPIWAARGAPESVKDADGKPVSNRAPINPSTGKLALTNKPRTWGTRRSAEKCADVYPEARQPGVGLMLGSHHAPEGLVRAGLDLDGCRDPNTGNVENWGEDIVRRFDTLTEVSLSGTGLHVVFHVREADIEALRSEGLLDNQGRKFGVKGDHLWTAKIIADKPFRLATTAMANKAARVIWAMVTRKQEYRRPAF